MHKGSMRLFVHTHKVLVNTVVATMLVAAAFILLPVEQLFEPKQKTLTQNTDGDSERYTVTYTLPNGQTQINSYAATPDEVRVNALEVVSTDLPTLPLPSPWFDPVYEPLVNTQLGLVTKVVGHLQDTIALNMLTVQELMLAGDVAGVIDGVLLLQENIKNARIDHDALMSVNERLRTVLSTTPVDNLQTQLALVEYVTASEVVAAEIGNLLSQYEVITSQSRIDNYQLPSQAEIEGMEKNALVITTALEKHGATFKAFVSAAYTER